MLYGQLSFWSGGGSDDNWSTPSNWGGTLPPNDSTARINFAVSPRITPSLDTPWSIHSLDFLPIAPTHTIGGSALTVGSGGVSNQSISIQSVIAPLIVADEQIWSASAGKLIIGALESTVVLNDILTLHAGHEIDFYANLTGQGSLIKTGTAALNLAGTLAPADFTVAEGILRLAAPNRISDGIMLTTNALATFDLAGFNETLLSLDAAGPVTLGSATLQLNGTSRLAGPLTGNGHLIANAGTSSVTIAGNATHTGGTSILSGALKIGEGESSGSIFGTVNASAGTFLLFTNPDSHFYFGNFQGGPGARFIQGGAGNLTLMSETTHSGQTVVQSGTLTLATNERISNSSDLIVDGNGTFNLAGFTETLLTIEGQGQVLLNGGSLDFSAVGSTFRGMIRGPVPGATVNDAAGSGNFIKRGSGSWVIEKSFDFETSGVLEVGRFEIVEGSFTSSNADLTVGTLRIAADCTAFIDDGTWQSSFVEVNGELTFENTSNEADVRTLGGLSGNGALTVSGPFNILVTALAGSGSVELFGSPPDSEGAASFQIDHDNDQALGWSVTGNVLLNESNEIIDGQTSFTKSGTRLLTIDRPLLGLASIHVTEGTLAFSSAGYLGAQFLSLENSAVLRVNAPDQTLGMPIFGSGAPAIDTGIHTLTTTGGIELLSDELRKIGSGALVVQSGGIRCRSIRIQAGQLSLGQVGLHDLTDIHLDNDATLHLGFSATDRIGRFLINGFSQATGTWGAVGSGAKNQSSRITGPGFLYVPTAYDNWIADYYPEGPQRDFDGDPDSDGIPNGIEFVIGSLPRADLETAAVSLSKLPMFSRSGNMIIYNFRRKDRSAYLNPFVQHGPNLESWTTATAGVSGVTIHQTAIPSETNVSMITVTIPLPVQIPAAISPPSYFARLAVMQEAQ